MSPLDISPPLELMRNDERTVNLILGSLQRIESGQHVWQTRMSEQLSELQTEMAIMKTRLDRNEGVAAEIGELKLAVARVQVKEDHAATNAAAIGKTRDDVQDLRLNLKEVQTKMAVWGGGVGGMVALVVALVLDWIRSR